MPLSVSPSPQANPEAFALRLVDRAKIALRCGDVVGIALDSGAIGLALAVETLTSEGLERLRALTGVSPVLALTRWRAAALGLTANGGPGVLTLALPAGLDADAIHALVEPGSRTAALTPVAGLVAAENAGELAVAAVRLAKLAALLPTTLIALTTADAETGQPGAVWCREQDLRLVRAADIVDYQRQAAKALRQVGEARVPLADAPDARIIAFRPSNGGHEHMAIVIGTPSTAEPVLIRLHSECFTGDLLGSLRCDCGDQLRRAIAAIASQGGGIVLYLAQEGRGIGLVNKLRAYQLQDQGYDTLDANEVLGFDADERLYLPAAEILHRLGFDRVRLMTNNPDKMRQLGRCGITVVERVPHVIESNDHNQAYLRTKAVRGGHLF